MFSALTSKCTAALINLTDSKPTQTLQIRLANLKNRAEVNLYNRAQTFQLRLQRLKSKANASREALPRLSTREIQDRTFRLHYSLKIVQKLLHNVNEQLNELPKRRIAVMEDAIREFADNPDDIKVVQEWEKEALEMLGREERSLMRQKQVLMRDEVALKRELDGIGQRRMTEELS